MEIFKQTTHIDFLGWRKQAAWFSVFLVIATVTSLFVRGMNMGIDFTGGTIVEMGYAAPADLDDQSIRQQSLDNPVERPGAKLHPPLSSLGHGLHDAVAVLLLVGQRDQDMEHRFGHRQVIERGSRHDGTICRVAT